MVAMSQLETEEHDVFDIGAPWGGLVSELLPMADKLFGPDDEFDEEYFSLKEAMSPVRHRKDKDNNNKLGGTGMVGVGVEESEQKSDSSPHKDISQDHDVSAAVSSAEFVGSTARLEILQRLLEKTQGAQGGKGTGGAVGPVEELAMTRVTEGEA